MDQDSQDYSEASDVTSKSKVNKTSINYLKSQEFKLQQEIEKNRQLIEVEKQKEAIGAGADSDVKPN